MEIIAAAYALPMTNGGPVVERGAIAVELGKIHAFGTRDELKVRFPEADVIEYPRDILLPGLVNAHCHLDLVDLQDQALTETDTSLPSQDFIDQIIASIEYKHDADPKRVIAGMQKGVNRLIETGTTCIGDMTHFEGSFHLLQEAGLRAVVFPEILAGQSEAAQHRYEIALALVEKYTDTSHDRIRVGLGPYAPYLLSRNLLKIISQHAKESGIQLQIHAAESFAEMEFFFDSQGPIATELFPTLGWQDLPPAQHKTPVQYLSEIGFFDAPSTVIGALHLSANDLPILRRHLARVVYCPTANKIMKHGSFPLGKLRECGIPIGLGTDCWGSRKGFNLWDEMRTGSCEGSTPLPTPKEVLQMATIGGARCLGLDHLTGTLEEGKKADYILVHAPQFSSHEECYSKLISETEPSYVKRVVVGGHILKAT
jgi:cytosine/adenosine deaminase-related metal-dependent hydrolase